MFVVDDSTLDKPYAKHMALVSRHWSGNHHGVVQGINLISLLWTDRDCRLLCDFRRVQQEPGWLEQERPLPADGETANQRDLSRNW